eukprot:TRINITY_DN93715_c0_g1_i1.p1 TRINITY_DN93715_c0_g1~~TRINITY_DN93715_c0_g1_i1.p1  ORF type:complete len:415 (-),score=76.33 TRINITY_DN93715_c0_g1_i1:184-1428(-)
MSSMLAASALLFACAAAVEVEVGVGGVMRSQLDMDRKMQERDRKEYEEHRKKHGRDALPSGEDPLSFAERFEIFKKSKAQVEAHNANPSKRWTATIDNHFADYTVAEFHALLGFRRLGRWWEQRSPSLIHVKPDVGGATDLKVKSSMDWRDSLTSTNFVKDQGSCGSCWAVAAVGALEVHAEIASAKDKAVIRNVSFKQVVDCTPNPNHCGGDGGCTGATSELAFDYVKQHGVHDFTAYAGNINADEPCKQSQISGHPYLKITGYERLETNKLEPLLHTLSNVGPASVSVDASQWNFYGGGIFDSCSQEAIVNHAVLAVGYGGEGANAYWLIRNSWGKHWGDHGFIKIHRHAKGIAKSPGESDDANWADAYCGWDKDPKVGVGCKGGPEKIPVCGMCGILSDSSYPTGVSVETV